jgi:hypothetical protein
VNSSGLVTARAIGATAIVVAATCCSQAADTIGISVSQVPTVIRVSPASIALDVGETELLSAAVLDANNNPLSGIGVQWSTGNTSVATVSGTGRVAGVGVGSTTVRARFAGLTGQASAQVQATAPASGGSTSGGSTTGDGSDGGGQIASVTTQNFGAIGENGWWTWGNYSVGQEDGRSVGRMVFPAGVSGGANGGGATGYNFPSPVNELDVTMDIKFSSNWVFHSIMNKIWFANTPGASGGDPIYVGVRGNQGFSVEKQGGTSDAPWYYSPNVGNVGPIQRNVWYTVRVRLVRNTSGQRNGSVEMWVNGTKTIEYRNIGIDDRGGFNHWKWDPVYGGVGGSSAAGQTMFMDNVVIRGR